MGTWIPISPNLDQNDCFVALSYLPNAAQLKAKRLDPGQPEFNSFWQRGDDKQLSASAVARVGLGAVGNASAKYQTRSFVWDVARYADKMDGTPNGGLIYGTRWGAGIRTRVTISSFDADLTMNLGVIAAAATLGRVDASFTIEGIGLCDPKLLGILPDPGRFDDTAFGKIKDAITTVVKDYLAPKKGLTSLPFMINVNNTAFFANPFERARSFLFAANQVAYKNPLAVALSRIDDTIDPLAVRTTYDLWAHGVDETAGPPQTATDSALAWLKNCGVI